MQIQKVFLYLIVFFLAFNRAAMAADTQISLQLDEVKRKEIIEDLAAKLNSDYVIADTGTTMAASLRASLETNTFRNSNSVYEFSNILTEHLFNIAHDKHLRVIFTKQQLTELSDDASPERMRKMNGAIIKVEILDGNIGYMRINAVPFLPASRDAISAAFAFLHNTDALILDNRGNFGGDPATVAWYMSYLSEGPSYLVNTFHWRKGNRIDKFKTTDLGKRSYGVKKPLYVLISASTISGGEELAYDIQACKRGIIVGEVTAGGANPAGTVQLVHNFQAIIPFARAINPVTGTNWEGVGVKPDTEVPSDQALLKAHRLAIARLLNQSDPRERELLEALATKLDGDKFAAEGRITKINHIEVPGTYNAITEQFPPLTIVQKESKLYLQIPGFPESKLVPVGNNRYKLEGFPDGFFLTLSMKGDKIRLLLEQPQWPILFKKNRVSIVTLHQDFLYNPPNLRNILQHVMLSFL